MDSADSSDFGDYTDSSDSSDSTDSADFTDQADCSFDYSKCFGSYSGFHTLDSETTLVQIVPYLLDSTDAVQGY